MKRLFVYPAAAAFLTLIIGLYVYLYFTDKPNQFWRDFNAARVTIDGEPFPVAHVYKHPDGNLLMDLGDRGWAVYWPKYNNIGLCNSIDYIPIPGYIYAYHWKDDQQPCVEMGTAKVETEANVMVGQNYIEFNSRKYKFVNPPSHQRIRVAW